MKLHTCFLTFSLLGSLFKTVSKRHNFLTDDSNNNDDNSNDDNHNGHTYDNDDDDNKNDNDRATHKMNEFVFLTNTVTLLQADVTAARTLTMYVSDHPPSPFFFPISCQLTQLCQIKLVL